MHAYTHAHTHTHAHTNTHMHAYRNTHACTHACTHAHTHACTHAHTHTHTLCKFHEPASLHSCPGSTVELQLMLEELSVPSHRASVQGWEQRGAVGGFAGAHWSRGGGGALISGSASCLVSPSGFLGISLHFSQAEGDSTGVCVCVCVCVCVRACVRVRACACVRACVWVWI